MSRSELRIAGFIAMLDAIMALPTGYAFLYFSAGSSSMAVNCFLSSVTTITTIVLTYLVLTFRKYLRTKHFYHGVDQASLLIIIICWLYAADNVIATFYPDYQVLNYINIILTILLGIAQIYYAYKLHKLDDSLYDLKDKYCLLTLITGILISTVVLSALSVLTSLISDIMLGTIFMLAAKNLELADSENIGKSNI